MLFLWPTGHKINRVIRLLDSAQTTLPPPRHTLQLFPAISGVRGQSRALLSHRDGPLVGE